MKLSIVTPKGLNYEGEVDYISVSGDNGELSILKDHIAIVVPIRFGFVKRVKDLDENYHIISGGLLEYNNNIATIIAQETSSGKTLEEAKNVLEKMRLTQKEKNRQSAMDFSEMERELALNLKNIQASKLP